MYTIKANGEILHNPWLAEQGRVAISPILTERLNSHGSLRFTVAPSNPLYAEITPRKTKIRVDSDTTGRKPWFGRVMELERGWNKCLNVYCEGILGGLNDAVSGPFGFKGSPAQLLSMLLDAFNQAGLDTPTLNLGNVSVTDPNNTIVRSSNYAATYWQFMEEKLFGSSLGGYIIHRYDEASDKHYVDYLRLDENDQYAHVSSQKIEFGKNLLDFRQFLTGSNVITGMMPYGALLPDSDPNYQRDPPENGSWDGNRVTVRSVNYGSNFIISQTGVSLWGYIGGTKVWDDVTVPANLLTKARAWLEEQIRAALTIEISAVDLSFVNADAEQIQVGDFVWCESKPHNLSEKLLCTEKVTNLTNLEQSSIILGAAKLTLSDIAGKNQKKS